MTEALIISYTVGMIFVSVQLSDLQAGVSADIAGLRSEVPELPKTAMTKYDLELLRFELSAIRPVAFN